MFTIGQLADAITGGDEFALRGLLRDVGLDVNRYIEDRTEAVPRGAVIDLAALRAGDRVGRKCAEILGG
jgi:hypothetical protein